MVQSHQCDTILLFDFQSRKPYSLTLHIMQYAAFPSEWKPSLQNAPPYAQSIGQKYPWWLLYQGDSREITSSFPAKSVDCVITSPPYFSQRNYEVLGQIGMEASIEEYVNNIQIVFQGLKNVLKPTGTVFLNLGDTYYSAKGEPKGKDRKHCARRLGSKRAVDGPGLGVPRKSQIGIPFRVALALQQDGWTLRSSIIWVKNTSVPEPSAKDRPWRRFEFVFLFSKQPKYYFDRTGLAGEEDVWFIEPDRTLPNRGVHYAPFPRDLVKRCLACGCPPSGIVLDPFVGGGTTMIAALEAGYPVIGIDLNPNFCSATAQVLCKL